MSLMFARDAHNYAANGYYPTDDETRSRISAMLAPASTGTMRLLDPCVGEGAALSSLAKRLGQNNHESYGIELNEDRAWSAKSVLSRVVHADIQDCSIGLRQFGFLLLNPPYGRLLADRARTGLGMQEKRLEKLFYQLTYGCLQFRGVMVLIIPRATFDEDFAKRIAKAFVDVRVFEAPEQRFNQLVVIGRKVRSTEAYPGAWRDMLEQAEASEVLPEIWDEPLYQIPAAPSGAVRLHAFDIDERQLAAEIEHKRGLWSSFDDSFATDLRAAPPPLCQPGDWHLALMLAGGAISGLVEHADGRRYVISGDTVKVKAESREQVQRDDDKIETVTTRIDRFRPVIRALDLTEASPTFGETLIVQ